MRRHDTVHESPLSHSAMRPREQPHSVFGMVSVSFFAHCETALRAALAAVFAGILHVRHQSPLTVLVAAVSILCTGPTLGHTLQLSTHSLVGALIAVPLSAVALGAGQLAPAAVDRRIVACIVFGVISACIGALRLPAVARKMCVPPSCHYTP